MITEAHPPFLVYGNPSYSEVDVDPSMTPIYTIETNLLEATPCHVTRLDFEASCSMGSCVLGRGCGHGHSHGDWGNDYISS